VTARALSSLPSLVELASPLLREGGILVCLKGRPDEEEIARGDAACVKCGMRRTDIITVEVPGLEAARAILVYERRGVSRTPLPRRNGMAQRQPLA
jgi:16S rRNA (guanine527-N7)-methyltransferase